MFILSTNRRIALVAVSVVLAGATAVIDHYSRHVQIAPIAVVFVLVIAAVGGTRLGLAAAILFGLGFTIAEHNGAGPVLDRDEALTALVRTTVFVLAVALIDVARRRTAQRVALAAERSSFEVAEARYRALGTSIPYGAWHHDGTKLIFVSQSFCDLVGQPLDEVLAGGWLKNVVAADAKRFVEQWERRNESGDQWSLEYRIRGRDGAYRSILSEGARVYRAGEPTAEWVGLNLDITQRKRAEDALRLLADAGRLLSTSLEPSAVLKEVSHLVVPRFADWCAIDMIDDAGEIVPTLVLHEDRTKLELARELRAAIRPDMNAPAGMAAVIRTGQPEIYPDITDDLLAQFSGEPRLVEMLRMVGMRSIIIVPLVARDSIFGTITFVAADSGRRYDQSDLELAVQLGRRSGLAYDNARLFAREHRVADTLQRATLPADLPKLDSVVLDATYLAGAQESEVGGDWYDAMQLPDGNIALSIGDVAGKGLRAAVAMGAVRQALRAAALENLMPAEVLNKANRLLLVEKIGMVTCVFGLLDPATRTFTFANAGHPVPLVGKRDGSVAALSSSGMPLGLFFDTKFEEKSVHLHEDSLLVLYTDGLVEYDRDLPQGEATLRAAVGAQSRSPGGEPAASIVRRVILSPASDDIAVITALLVPASADRIDVTMPALPENLRPLRKAFARFAMAAGFSPADASLVQIAVGEALNNVIEHAYGAREGSVRLRGWNADGRLNVTVEDTGKWREPRADQRGRGISIERALAESVTIDSTDRGTKVHLIFVLPEERARDGASAISHPTH